MDRAFGDEDYIAGFDVMRFVVDGDGRFATSLLFVFERVGVAAPHAAWKICAGRFSPSLERSILESLCLSAATFSLLHRWNV
jgi:hypothetical protein